MLEIRSDSLIGGTIEVSTRGSCLRSACRAFVKKQRPLLETPAGTRQDQPVRAGKELLYTPEVGNCAGIAVWL